jgi:hypothetical protein
MPGSPDAPDAGESDGTGDAPVDAPRPTGQPGGRWVRPVAIAVLLLALALIAGVIATEPPEVRALGLAPGLPAVGLVLLGITLALLALAVIVIRPERGTRRALVLLSGAWSLTFLLGLVLAWFANAGFIREDHWHGTPVQSDADVAAYLATEMPPGIEPILLRTGVMVKSLEFLSGDNVQITGYAWQRVGQEVPDDLILGLVFAEGTKDSYRLSEAYRYEENGVETIGWFFEMVLRQPFVYAEYPFDQQDLWIRLWARDFTEDVILVPDFAAYLSMHPGSLPGMERDVVYGGWTPLYSGFSLSQQPYISSFGIGDAGQYPGIPELYFNLILDRNFAGPFFEHLIFAIAVMLLLFGLLVLTTNDDDLKARFQLSTAGVFGAASGLLFAVILKHNQLRTVIGSSGVVYIEVIPILLYGAIVAVVLNAILLASPYTLRVLHLRGNVVPVLAYWPVMLGILYGVTLVVFFQT